MEFFEVIKRVGIFIICAQTIQHFKPGEQYEKYIKLLIGFMVLVQMVNPVLNFLQDGGGEKFQEMIQGYQVRIEEEWEKIEYENEIAEEDILNSAMKEIKSEINNHISGEGYEVVTISQYGEKLIIYVRKSLGSGIVIEPIGNSHKNEEKLHVLSKNISEYLQISEQELEVRE